MADAAQSAQAQSDRDLSSSLTAAGCAAFLLWVFGMIDAGKFFVPDSGTAMFMGASILPLWKAIGARFIREIDHDTGCGVNAGAPAAQPEQLNLFEGTKQ